jgi:hypothetical protein
MASVFDPVSFPLIPSSYSNIVIMKCDNVVSPKPGSLAAALGMEIDRIASQLTLARDGKSI